MTMWRYAASTPVRYLDGLKSMGDSGTYSTTSQHLIPGAGLGVSAGTFHWFGNGVTERLASP